ncbi:hypothetical protein DM785_02580 [Deinococcus actinosclerus]|nr:hypothetical protein DM785_02580 [Deinococcus actinosclerus]
MTDARRVYRPTPPAPTLEEIRQPISVQRGALIIQGAHASVVIPAGGLWPGLDALPDTVREELGHVIPHTLADSRLQSVESNARTVKIAVAFVTAQLLPHGSGTDRIQRATRLFGHHFTLTPDAVAGALLSLSRIKTNNHRNRLLGTGEAEA